jgi:hypothetical protein
MLKDFRKCRTSSNSYNLHRQTRRIVRDAIIHEDFESLPLYQSMRAHHGKQCGYDDERRWQRGQSFKGIDKLILKYIDKPYRELEDRVRGIYTGVAREQAIRNLRADFGIEHRRWSSDYFIDEDGICCINIAYKSNRPVRERYVVPVNMDWCFIKFEGRWYDVVLSEAKSHVIRSFDGYYLNTVWHTDAFGQAMYNRSWLALECSGYHSRHPISRKLASNKQLRWIENYLTFGTFVDKNDKPHEYNRTCRNV